MKKQMKLKMKPNKINKTLKQKTKKYSSDVYKSLQENYQTAPFRGEKELKEKLNLY